MRHGVNLTRLREKNCRIPDKGAPDLGWQVLRSAWGQTKSKIWFASGPGQPKFSDGSAAFSIQFSISSPVIVRNCRIEPKFGLLNLSITGASPFPGTDRSAATSGGSGNVHGGKIPYQYVRSWLSRSPETTSLDIHQGVFTAVCRQRELLISTLLQCSLHRPEKWKKENKIAMDSEGWAHFSEVKSSAMSGPPKLVKRHATVHNCSDIQTTWRQECPETNGSATWPVQWPVLRGYVRAHFFGVFFTSSSDKLCLLPLNGGMLRRIPSLTRRSWISNPLSAIWLFPRGTSSRRLHMPLSIKCWRSLLLPASSRVANKNKSSVNWEQLLQVAWLWYGTYNLSNAGSAETKKMEFHTSAPSLQKDGIGWWIRLPWMRPALFLHVLPFGPNGDEPKSQVEEVYPHAGDTRHSRQW